MLPARFQVCRISPSLRSAVSYTHVPPPLRFRPCAKGSSLGSRSSTSRATALFSTSAPEDDRVGKEVTTTATSQPLPGKVEPRLSLTFTCTVVQCGERSTHEFSKRAYTSGIVLAQCPKCKNRHLIADHLGWFKELTKEGKLPTVEELVKAKGEKIRKGKLNLEGDTEYFE